MAASPWLLTPSIIGWRLMWADGARFLLRHGLSSSCRVAVGGSESAHSAAVYFLSGAAPLCGLSASQADAHCTGGRSAKNATARGYRSGQGLIAGQRGIGATALDQFRVGARFHNPALQVAVILAAENMNAVGVAHRRQTMGDDHGSAPFH